MSDVYYIDTPPSGLVVSLAEAKAHLRIDDDVAGAKASKTFGSGNSQLVLTAKYDGTYANDFDAVIIQSGNSTALSVSYASNLFTINLATDGMGDVTSTVNDVIAALVDDTTISQMLTVTNGTGNGTGIMVAAASASFSGGLDGTSFDDTYVSALSLAAQNYAETILRKKLLEQTLVKKENEFPCGRYPIALDWGKVTSVAAVRYYDSAGTLQTLTSPYTLFVLNNAHVPSQLELLPGQSWPSFELDRLYPMEIEFVVGAASAADIAEEIKVAIKLIIGHWYSNRENVQISSGLTALTIPHGAEALLWTHRDYRL